MFPHDHSCAQQISILCVSQTAHLGTTANVLPIREDRYISLGGLYENHPDQLETSKEKP